MAVTAGVFEAKHRDRHGGTPGDGGGDPLRLSAKEMQLLLTLAEKPRRMFTRDELSRKVWGGPDLKTSRPLDSHVHRMAKKFRAAGVDGPVENVWGCAVTD